jgi:hypothetical protein
VELGELLLGLLWFILGLAVLTALSGGLAAMAFRVNLGATPWPLDRGDFWWRCLLAGALLAVYLVVAYFASFVLVGRDAAGLFWILLAPYPVVAVLVLTWSLALDDWLEGAKVFLVQHLVPILLLALAALVVAPLRGWLNGFNPFRG